MGDLALSRFPSYAMQGVDRYGNTWQAVVTDFTYTLPERERRWWYAKTPPPG